jgi:transcription antitermination factor NusG
VVVPNWFAVFTSPRHEKRIEHYFSDREIERYFSNRTLNIICRFTALSAKWNNGLRVNLALPLFPGYIFVRIRRTERKRVLEARGALAVVGGTTNEMAPLTEAEVDALRFCLHLRQVNHTPSDGRTADSHSIRCPCQVGGHRGAQQERPPRCPYHGSHYAERRRGN